MELLQPPVSPRAKHSPLGASGAERWMNCPGSITLIKMMGTTEEPSDEPDYRANGIAAHEAAADCLAHHKDAWEVVGQEFHGITVDPLMADAIQVYIDTVRPGHADAYQVFIEYPVSSPIHELFYGTLDEAALQRTPDPNVFDLDVDDYKHGEGIVVEPKYNPQLMYYAFGIISDLQERGLKIRSVRLRIIQPRAFHHAGPVREWVTTAQYIVHWAETELVPAMERTAIDADLQAGEWCRFCPAKLICPLMVGLYGAAAKANPKNLVSATNEQIGREYVLTKAVKAYIKAVEDEAFKRNNLGQEVPGTKLVDKQANRVWKEGAKDALLKDLPLDEIMSKPVLMSPSEIEKLGAKAKEIVKEYAYTPKTGLTVALVDDRRVAVKITTSVDAFAGALANLKEAA